MIEWWVFSLPISISMWMFRRKYIILMYYTRKFIIKDLMRIFFKGAANKSCQYNVAWSKKFNGVRWNTVLNTVLKSSQWNDRIETLGKDKSQLSNTLYPKLYCWGMCYHGALAPYGECWSHILWELLSHNKLLLILLGSK